MRSDKSKNNRRIAVIVDDRESKSEVIKFLSETKNVSVDIKRLSLGDYLVDNRLMFERKTMNDFALSIIDGRLFSQAIRLASSKYNSVLLLEGTGKELTETGIRREAMQGALIAVSIVLGIPVLRSKSPSESAQLALADYVKQRLSLRVRKVFLVQKGTHKGKPLSVRGIQKRMESYAKKAGLPVSCHQLRHTMATQLLNADADLVSIQDLLGHSRIKTTQRYCRVSNLKVQRDYFKAIEEVIKRTTMSNNFT